MSESIFTDPPVTPLVECPNCKRLLAYGTQRCPDCSEEIQENYARLSRAVVATNTKACAMTNTIKALDLSAAIALVLALISYFSKPPTIPLIATIWPALALLAIVVWFRRFGGFKLGDQDFVRARRQMQLRLVGWCLFTAALWIVYFFIARSG